MNQQTVEVPVDLIEEWSEETRSGKYAVNLSSETLPNDGRSTPRVKHIITFSLDGTSLLRNTLYGEPRVAEATYKTMRDTVRAMLTNAPGLR